MKSKLWPLCAEKRNIMTVLGRGHSAVAAPGMPGVIYMSKGSREGEGTEKGSIPICGRNLHTQETTENASLGGQRELPMILLI